MVVGIVYVCVRARVRTCVCVCVRACVRGCGSDVRLRFPSEKRLLEAVEDGSLAKAWSQVCALRAVECLRARKRDTERKRERERARARACRCSCLLVKESCRSLEFSDPERPCRRSKDQTKAFQV